MQIDVRMLSEYLQYYHARYVREQIFSLPKDRYRWKKCFNCGARISKPYQNPCCFECYRQNKQLINWRPTK